MENYEVLNETAENVVDQVSETAMTGINCGADLKGRLLSGALGAIGGACAALLVRPLVKKIIKKVKARKELNETAENVVEVEDLEEDDD